MLPQIFRYAQWKGFVYIYQHLIWHFWVCVSLPKYNFVYYNVSFFLYDSFYRNVKDIKNELLNTVTKHNKKQFIVQLKAGFEYFCRSVLDKKTVQVLFCLYDANRALSNVAITNKVVYDRFWYEAITLENQGESASALSVTLIIQTYKVRRVSTWTVWPTYWRRICKDYLTYI